MKPLISVGGAAVQSGYKGSTFGHEPSAARNESAAWLPMSQVNYPEGDRAVLEQVVSDPRFQRILKLPTFAWQEILLLAGVYATLIGGSFLYLTGAMPYAVVFLMHTLAVYAVFTPLHDATHRSLSGNRTVNDLLGTVAALPIFPGVTTGFYRYLHLQHHRHTGVPGDDPDEVVVSTRMPWRALSWVFIDVYWMVWYARRVRQRPLGEAIKSSGNIAFFFGWHAAWLMSPYAWEFVLLWLIPQRCGVTLLVYLFAAIQHPEGVRQAERPLQATRMFKGGWLMRAFTLSQSQHLMHHMFPSVPYYRYNAAWELAGPHLQGHEIVWDWPVGKLRGPRPADAQPADTIMKARIAAVEAVSEEVRAYVLAPAEGAVFPSYMPGAHIDVHVAPGLVRQYSLTTAPRPDGCYRIGVKREETGRGGSLRLHEEFVAGRVIDIRGPRNLFPLSDTASHVVLVSGGIGITPLLAMAEALHARGADFEFHVCARSRAVLPFAEELSSAPYADRLGIHLDDDGEPAQGISEADLPEWHDGMEMYLCGPSGFMDYVTQLGRRRGWPAYAIRTESFTASDASGRTNQPFQVLLARSHKVLDVPAERSLLDVLLEQNISVPSSCEQGLCGTCVCMVIEGEVDHRDVVLDAEARARGSLTTCVSRATGERLTLDL